MWPLCFKNNFIYRSSWVINENACCHFLCFQLCFSVAITVCDTMGACSNTSRGRDVSSFIDTRSYHCSHYYNTLMQYTANFNGCINDNL